MSVQVRMCHLLSLASLARRNPRAALTTVRVIRERLTYLDPNALAELAGAVLDVERNRVPGTLVEAGCALGGSALVIAAAKNRNRPFALFDTFGLIPPPSNKDAADVHRRYETITRGEATGIGGDVYYGYQPNLQQRVTNTFARYRLPLASHAVRLVPGLFQDTLPRETDQVALAHVDGDWYESVAVCLQAITPRLTVGGRIVVDDYDAWSGCRVAVDEFLTTEAGSRLRRERRSRLHLVCARASA
jgi:hypothetical protein